MTSENCLFAALPMICANDTTKRCLVANGAIPNPLSHLRLYCKRGIHTINPRRRRNLREKSRAIFATTANVRIALNTLDDVDSNGGRNTTISDSRDLPAEGRLLGRGKKVKRASFAAEQGSRPEPDHTTYVEAVQKSLYILRWCV